MELATSLNLFDEHSTSPLHAVERLARAGFRVLDFPFCDWLFNDSPFIGPDWLTWLTEIRKCADNLGVRFSQGHGPCDLVTTAEEARRMLPLSHRSIEGAAVLGIDWIVFHPITTIGAFDQDHMTAMKQLNQDIYRELLSTAAESRTGIALENMYDRCFRPAGSRSYGSTPAELIDLVTSLDQPHVGICWDTGHAALQRLDQVTAIHALGHRLKAVHIQDTDGSSDQHTVPFLGTLDFDPILAALKDVGYQGDFTYEIPKFTRAFPDALREQAAQFAHAVGQHVLDGGNAVEVEEGRH